LEVQLAKSGGVTLAIRPEPGTPSFKVTKIVPYAKGGFSVLTPYHNQRQGYLAKVPVNYRELGDILVPRSEVVGYSVNDRVKLSYHPDGFAQFSGEVGGKVISGRDEQTGEPKGIGLMTNPLKMPIWSGPTFGVVLWGLQEFEQLGAKDTPALVFEEEDFYYRDCTPETANGWIVEAWVFPLRMWSGVRKRGDRYVLMRHFEGFERYGATLELYVIPLPNQPVFLGVFAGRVGVSFDVPSGWTLNGPGYRDQTGRGRVLMAFYPRLPMMDEDKAGTMDYEA
jgi:hypothetical protein